MIFLKKSLVLILLILSVWILSPMTSEGLTLDANRTDGVLRIGFDPSLPPYQFLEDGEYQGFTLDLIQKIAEEGNFRIELIPLSRSESLAKFQLKEIDAILGIRYDAQLEDQMNFSESLVNSTVSIIARNEKYVQNKDLLGVEPVLIAVERSSTEFEYVKNIKKANFNEAFSQQAVFELLLNKRADMMIGVRHVAEYLIDKNQMSLQFTISNSYETPVDFYLGIDQGKTGYLNLINTELRALKLSGGYETIYNTWINDKAIENQKRIERNLMIMGLIIASVLCIAIIAGYINVQLNRKVAEKTKALSNANEALEHKILEIKNTNELKDFMFESSPRSIAIFDNDGRITAMNQPALEVCGLKEVPVGERVYNLAPFSMMLESNVERVLSEGESHIGKELDYEAFGRRWVLRYVIYPLNDYELKTRGAIITIEDITEEKILREQIAVEEKNRALVQMISGIAHEIRNPLTSIKAYVELLPRKKDNEAFQKQLVRVVPAEVERVSRLIENLIDYVRPKTRHILSVQVSELLESCVLLFQHTASSKGIDLQLSTEGTLAIQADKDQIKQVVINLMLNAIDAVNEMRALHHQADGFWIHLSAEAAGEHVKIRIKDNGIGMTEQELSNVYELFYTTKVKGSGIGLPLSKQMVEDNEGQIQIESAKNQGTTIVLTFRSDVK